MSLDYNNEFLKKFGFKPDVSKNFLRALTHTSYANEKNLPRIESYERLEFLGDSILKLAVSEILYKKFPQKSEGELSQVRSYLVSDEFLSKIALEIGIDKLILLSKPEENMGGRKKQSILACTFEAFLGAMYLENQKKQLEKFIQDIYLCYLDTKDFEYILYNPKAILQEYTQSVDKNLPIYKTISEIALKNERIFEVEVFYNDKKLGDGKGKSKREAQQNAALKACEKLGILGKEIK